jgi:4-alpha-glucanotransferase
MNLLEQRAFGILLPVFSLPGSTLDSAEGFVSFLGRSGARIWQVLPLGPTHVDLSPYLAMSAHAGNPALIGLQNLQRGMVCERDLHGIYAALGVEDCRSTAYREFCDKNAEWLPGYALFRALRRAFGNTAWYQWPENFRDREQVTMEKARRDFAAEIKFEMWQQYHFFAQWRRVREFCNTAGVLLFGDMPLYVSHDSADVWQYPELFKLRDDGSADAVAGVPPDYFAPQGQRWGNPIFDWPSHQGSGFEWWIRRMRTQVELYDIVRIDHFRGLESYWEVPAEAETAETGNWRQGPGEDLLNALFDALPSLNLVAEDLGTITAEVDALRTQFGLPGIRVLQFGFDGSPDNPHAPHNVQQSMVLYTGTHDNDTSVGWCDGIGADERDRLSMFLNAYDAPFPRSFISAAFASQANTVVVPMQDLLGLDSSARTNTPGTTEGNWHWCLPSQWNADQLAEDLSELARRYHRNK